MAGRIIPIEHAKRLLREIDLDLDDFITLPDLIQFVLIRKFPTFPEELLAKMFAEANVSHDCLVDVEQLAKAVGGQFPHRTYNEDWYRLFELALVGPQTDRLTALPPSPLPPQQIRTNFELEDELLTFSPHTNQKHSRNGIPADVTSIITTPLVQKSSAQESSQPQEEARAMSVNDCFRRTDDTEGGTLSCSLRSQNAFRQGTQIAVDASNGVGWRRKLPIEVKHPLPLPTQLFHGLHEFDWHLAPSSACIPLRVDGEVTRVGSGLKPLRLLATENSQKRDHNSQTHRREAGIDGPVAHETFLTNFPAANARACTRTLKESAAKERLDMEPSSIQTTSHAMDFANGQPTKQSFRLPFDHTAVMSLKPYITGGLGYHWTRKERRPADTLYTLGAPLRMAMTENQHPASRHVW